MLRCQRIAVLLFVGLAVAFSTPRFAAAGEDAEHILIAFQQHDVRRLTEFVRTSTDKTDQILALQCLIRLNDPQVERFLIQELDENDPDLVEIALWGLPTYIAQGVDPETVTRLQAMAHHESLNVRKTAGIVAEDLQDPDTYIRLRNGLASKDSDDRKEALDYFTRRKDLSVQLYARDQLANVDPLEKQTAVILLHGLDDRDSLPTIHKLIDDPAPGVRAAAILVVGDWEEENSFALLKPALKDPYPLVRSSAISALGRHQTPEISNALAALSTDSVVPVRIALAKALSRFATPASANALLGLVLDDNPLVRDPAVDGLVRFRDPVITTKMNAFLKDKSSRRRRRAAILYLSDPSWVNKPEIFLTVLHDRDPDVRLNAVQAVIRMPGTTAKAKLPYLMLDPNKDIRLAILQAMPELLKLHGINTRLIRQNLMKLANDPESDVKEGAAKALELMPPVVPAGLPGLKKGH